MVAALEVSVKLPPWQNVLLLPAVIVGVAGNGFTKTVVANDAAEVQLLLFVLVTEKLSLELTTMLCVVAPLLHTFPDAALEVNITLPPLQKVIGPFAEIVGVGKTQAAFLTNCTLVAFTCNSYPAGKVTMEKLPLTVPEVRLIIV